MKYGGKTLILDNFRDILFDFSVDIQDIVRSAILDGVDISSYINECKNNPYKLDQIRLSKKEGIKDTFFSVSGEALYTIRKMKKRGVNLSQIENQLKSNLSEEYMECLLKWVDDGINISKLNIAIIPKSLLDTFDYGLRNGFDMSVFNDGVSYDPKYIMECLKIMYNNKSVAFLLKGKWSLDCLELLTTFSKINRTGKWNGLVGVIDDSITAERLRLVIDLVKNSIDYSKVVKLQSKTSGNYVYQDKCLKVVLEAFRSGLDLDVIIEETDPEKMRTLKDELNLKKKRKVSGRIIKN